MADQKNLAVQQGQTFLPVQQGQAFLPVESRGLFVGINTFVDDEIPKLGFAVDDAVDLAFLFSCELGLISPKALYLALSGEPQKPETADQLEWLLDAGARRIEPDYTSLYKQVFELGKATGKGGLFILTVSSHGFTDQGEDFVAVRDSLRRRVRATGLAFDILLDDISKATTERRLLLLDTCRNRLDEGTKGLGEDPGMSPSLAETIGRTKGLSILNSTTTGGYSYESEVLKNGVFTAAILDGLRGRSQPDANGVVTARSLGDYANREVSEWVEKHRPDHIGISNGISCTTQGMPLSLASVTPDDVSRREAHRLHELDKMRLRRNIGPIITGKHFDAIAHLLEGKEPSSKISALERAVRSLDGTERAQQRVVDLYEEEETPLWRSLFREGMSQLYGLQRSVDIPAAQRNFLAAAETGNPIPRVWVARLKTAGFCSFPRDLTAARSVGRQELGEVEASANREDTDAALVLGFAYLEGIGDEVDLTHAIASFRQAAEKGDLVAMNGLGTLDGRGVDPPEALSWCLQAAEAGNSMAMSNLGWRYQNGQGVGQDYSMAAKWYRAAADRGYAAAMNSLGYFYEWGNGLPKDVETAAKWYRAAADRGYAPAMNSLGYCYEWGEGLPKDVEAAAKWYRLGADLGDSNALGSLGWAYAKGKGVELDAGRAVEYLRRAIDLQNSFAMRGLAALYADGDLLPRDYGKALELWTQAAELGDSNAMADLGEVYKIGLGFAPDMKMAASWYHRAADAGKAEAAYKLAQCYASGKGVEKDPAMAAHWYRNAATLGYKAPITKAGQMPNGSLAGSGLLNGISRFWKRLTK